MSKIPWWAWAIGVGAVGYILYKTVSGVKKTAGSAVNAVSTAIADTWLSLPWVGLPPNMTVLGEVVLPDGTLVPMSQLQNGKIREDPNDNVLANINGNIYQLSPSDANGNYPATLLGPAPAGG